VAPRIDVHVPTTTHPGLETGLDGKVGIDRDDAAEGVRRAGADPGVEPVGLHLHIGPETTSVEPYRQAWDRALDLADEAEAVVGGHALEMMSEYRPGRVPGRSPSRRAGRA
jgi:diaminopimelate decarboxylase